MGEKKVPWDARIAADAAMAEHCKNLGGVILQPPKKPTGVRREEAVK